MSRQIGSPPKLTLASLNLFRISSVQTYTFTYTFQSCANVNVSFPLWGYGSKQWKSTYYRWALVCGRQSPSKRRVSLSPSTVWSGSEYGSLVHLVEGTTWEPQAEQYLDTILLGVIRGREGAGRGGGRVAMPGRAGSTFSQGHMPIKSGTQKTLGHSGLEEEVLLKIGALKRVNFLETLERKWNQRKTQRFWRCFLEMTQERFIWEPFCSLHMSAGSVHHVMRGLLAEVPLPRCRRCQNYHSSWCLHLAFQKQVLWASHDVILSSLQFEVREGFPCQAIQLPIPPRGREERRGDKTPPPKKVLTFTKMSGLEGRGDFSLEVKMEHLYVEVYLAKSYTSSRLSMITNSCCLHLSLA